MREAALSAMTEDRKTDLHLALGTNLRGLGGDASPWLFDAVRHLNAASPRLDAEGRLGTARLDLVAGKRARRAAAFPLAYGCFRAGAGLLGPDAWSEDYALALALHGGAAETAYLSAAFDQLDAHVTAVKTNARTVLDQLIAWEVEIDAHIARRQYAPAVDAALTALRLLDVDLPASPGEAEVGAELQRAMEALARVGPDGMLAREPATSPAVVAAMRMQSRISSAAYFARPMLFPVIACRLVTTSIEHGLSPATPYALAVYGVVLNSLGLLREAHTWGEVALALLDRFEDRTLAARTLHVVHDLVCTFTVPLAGTLDSLRRAVTVGRETGDLEYTAYAAHAWVHNSFYAAKPLEPLLAEALGYGRMMRGLEQVNALHVHTPFEQLLKAFTGRLPDASRLDGDGFDEQAAVTAAEADGSRSALCIVRLLMGIVRYHFGSVAEASEHLEAARPYLDGVVSTWHVPMFHQYAALAIAGLPAEARAARQDAAAGSLAALSGFAQHGPMNFAHRVALVEGETARAAGDLERATASFERAIEGAEDGGFSSDEGLAHELMARCREARKESALARGHRAAARDAYARWGAKEKVARLRD
jgi:predicted ATPase